MSTNNKKNLMYLRLKQNKIDVTYKDLLFIDDLLSLNCWLINRGFLVVKTGKKYELKNVRNSNPRTIKLEWGSKLKSFNTNKFFRYYGFKKNTTIDLVLNHRINPIKSEVQVCKYTNRKSLEKTKHEIRDIYYIEKSDDISIKIQKSIKDLLEDMFSKELNSFHIQAYSTNRSNITNAQLHVGYNYCIKSDIKNFFENITFMTFEKILNEKFRQLIFKKKNKRDMDKSFIEMIKKYCFINDVDNGKNFLPQGFLTSPTIANIVGYFEIDKKIIDSMDIYRNKIVYSRYSDDITFSFDDESQISMIKEKLNMFNKLSAFTLREDKTYLYSPTDKHKRITGIQVGESLSISRRKIRKVEEGFRYIINELMKPSTSKEDVYINEAKSLRAQLIYYNQVNNTNKRVIREIFVVNKQITTINKLGNSECLRPIMKNTLYYGNLNLISSKNENIISLIIDGIIYFVMDNIPDEPMYYEAYYKKGKKSFIIDQKLIIKNSACKLYSISLNDIGWGDKNFYSTSINEVDDYTKGTLELVLKMKYTYLDNEKVMLNDYNKYCQELDYIIENFNEEER